MKALSGREFARLVERHGWTLLRVHGSHGNGPLKIGLLRNLAKLAELPEGALD